MEKRRKIVLQYTLAGALVGYFFFHPLIMLFSFLMSVKHTGSEMANTVGIMAIIQQSFAISMLPWSLSIAMFNGIIGFYYGTFKAERLAREELILNLQKALADVKKLSGMLPICAWCKKIRNDEGYWQQIDAYIKSHTDLDFTHGICNDCAKKEYPELYQDLEKE